MITATAAQIHDAASKMLPFIARRLNAGETMDEAIRGASSDWLGRLQEMIDGETERAQAFRAAIWDSVATKGGKPEWATGTPVEAAVAALSEA